MSLANYQLDICCLYRCMRRLDLLHQRGRDIELACIDLGWFICEQLPESSLYVLYCSSMSSTLLSFVPIRQMMIPGYQAAGFHNGQRINTVSPAITQCNHSPNIRSQVATLQPPGLTLFPGGSQPPSRLDEPKSGSTSIKSRAIKSRHEKTRCIGSTRIAPAPSL